LIDSLKKEQSIMAAINDLIARIQDPNLRLSIEKELKELTKQKKFGLVFEKHIPEMTLLYDYPISRGCKIIRKSDDDKKLSEDILWEVKKISKEKATCVHTVTNEEQSFNISDLICVAKNGEPIYPCLKYVDSIQNAPDSDLWHALIEADNYHALQLLAYLYPGMVDCIYIDPPYNSGARDWKYNNDYVDSQDKYPHSKWLAMMESRLQLARKLLNPNDSVLIVTIDEKEYNHLGCLLEELFPEARIQMITSIISAKGVVRTGQFSRVEEYLYIIEFGESKLIQFEYNMLDSDIKKVSNREIEWLGFRRRAPQAIRGSRPNQFYPIYVDKQKGTIHSIGEVIPYGVDRFTVSIPDNCISLWPLSKEGHERLWSLQQKQAVINWKKGYLKVNWNPKQETGTVYYLPEGTISDIEKKKATTLGYNEDGSINAIYYAIGTTPPKRVWNMSTHNAETFGTNILNDIIGKRFDYPKSLYAVHDVLRFFVANKPNALILDFFAGSGTTLHAVNLLNKEDGGHRRCIMVTNNEVSADEETVFRENGLHKGDEEWEKFGIARYVNWPRTKCSIEGVDVNGQPLQDKYVTSKTQEKKLKRTIKQLSFVIPEGTQGIKVKKQIVALINDKNMPQNSVNTECPYIVKEDATTAILFDINSIDDFFEEIHENIDVIYVVSTDNKAFNTAKRKLEELPERTKSVPVKIPMSEGFKANAAFYKLTFLDKEAVSIGAQLDKLLSILWMKAGAHGVCPTHLEGEYAVLPENRMAILIEEYGFEELKEELSKHPEIETVYIIEDSEDNYRALAAQINVKNTYQLYRDYLDNFKINIENR
jgi:adenine-specific DNA-methyltransferase